MRKLLIALCACTALFPATASAQENLLNRLPASGTAIGVTLQTKEDVPVCENADDAIKFREAMDQYTHHAKPFITQEELYRRKPERCGFVNIGKWIAVNNERIYHGTPVMVCLSIFDDWISAIGWKHSDACFWTTLSGDDWDQIRLERIRHRENPQTGESIDGPSPFVFGHESSR